MLYITERKTTQTDLRDMTVLTMVSLFVVAYPHEVVEFKQDDFAGFIAKARSEGRLLLDVPEGAMETVEVSETRKGFLIKCSLVTEVVTETPVADVSTEEVFVAVPGFPNYEFSKLGNLRNVNTGKLLTADNAVFKVSVQGNSQRLAYANLMKMCGFAD